MKYQDIKTSITSRFAAPGGNKVVPFIIGRPGGGKSACARDALRTLGFDESNTVEFTALS